jgi:tRNA-specific 2-thiouridylase
MMTTPEKFSKKAVRAVGLLSGGLDSTLAAKLMKDLGIDVYGVYFSMPWGCGKEERVKRAAELLKIPLTVITLDEDYLKMIQNPKHGYGSAFNPCIDCHAYMAQKAGAYMKKIHADFVFTGEVLGQRPMSQLKHSLRLVEEESGLKGRFLRPLCAKLLEPTLVETQGLIDREKLLSLSGRSRKEQIRLAKEWGITDYPWPAGGCLLTDKNFAKRLKDIFKHGYRDQDEIVSLKWGRHFRLNENFKAILGRNEKENDLLIQHAHKEDYILELPDRRGPSLILKGEDPTPEILALAAGLIQRFSRHKEDPSIAVEYRMASHTVIDGIVTSQNLSEEKTGKMKI